MQMKKCSKAVCQFVFLRQTGKTGSTNIFIGKVHKFLFIFQNYISILVGRVANYSYNFVQKRF